MKNMKKLLIVAALTAFCSTLLAQSATPVTRFIPLLSGYNVALTTNGAALGLGQTNVLFTSYNGQVLYSLTNNTINGTLITNSTAPDAFKIVPLTADVNGDYNANASVIIMLGNTNWIPQVVTNAQGQWYTPSFTSSNALTGGTNVGWVLAPSALPNWFYPATTNYYPVYNNQSTNPVVVTLYRGITSPQGTPFGSSITPTLNTTNALWETSSAFSFTVLPNGIYTTTVITNLPASWLQGAKLVYATVSCVTNNVSTSNTGQGVLLNQLGILQPQP